MAPKKISRGSIPRSSAVPSAATSQAPVTPSRPNRPSAILTTPGTPSGPWPPNSPAPNLDPDRVSGSLSPSTQPQEEENVQTVSEVVAYNNEEQQTVTPTTKPFCGTEDEIDILPDDSSSATTTAIPTRRTTMEQEMQWFLSLPTKSAMLFT